MCVGTGTAARARVRTPCCGDHVLRQAYGIYCCPPRTSSSFSSPPARADPVSSWAAAARATAQAAARAGTEAAAAARAAARPGACAGSCRPSPSFASPPAAAARASRPRQSSSASALLPDAAPAPAPEQQRPACAHATSQHPRRARAAAPESDRGEHLFFGGPPRTPSVAPRGGRVVGLRPPGPVINRQSPATPLQIAHHARQKAHACIISQIRSRILAQLPRIILRPIRSLIRRVSRPQRVRQA